MTDNLTAALLIARASVPYFQDQYDTKQNWHTAARLADAIRTLETLEGRA